MVAIMFPSALQALDMAMGRNPPVELLYGYWRINTITNLPDNVPNDLIPEFIEIGKSTMIMGNSKRTEITEVTTIEVKNGEYIVSDPSNNKTQTKIKWVTNEVILITIHDPRIKPIEAAIICVRPSEEQIIKYRTIKEEAMATQGRTAEEIREAGKRKQDELGAYAGLPSDLDIDLPNGVVIKFKKIPAGTFMMGSPESEEGRSDNEIQHEVTISKVFYLGICEVTQAQYEVVMGYNPSEFTSKGRTRPVETVSWYDATEFCRKASALTGKYFRLPTEAEWEYACRAGTATPFNTGETLSPKQANVVAAKNWEPLAVGSFPPNAWGLYDMHGNVWEWCSDWYGAYATGKKTDTQGASNGEDRILRGGCWGNDPRSCRSARRGRIEPAYRFYNIGFRVALD